MSFLKKWRSNNDQHNTALAKDAGRDAGIANLGDFRQQIDRTFDEFWRRFDRNPWDAMETTPGEFPSDNPGFSNWPAVDVAEDDKMITIRVDVPGLREKDLDIETSGNLLTIRGSRRDEWSDQKRGIRRRERVSGSFARTIALPAYTDPQKVLARYDNGTLTVTVPKIPGKEPRRIQITAA